MDSSGARCTPQPHTDGRARGFHHGGPSDALNGCRLPWSGGARLLAWRGSGRLHLPAMARRDPSQRASPRDAAVRIVRALRDSGQVAYLAGGCVRDELLGRSPSDYDVATDALPDRVHKIFRRSRYIGEAFGVVQVHMAGHWVEVATFRSEWGYSDKRRPDHVQFSDAEHDARRRDFTINGLFADPLERDPATGGDRIIDFVGGREDLAARLVRAIGEPGDRFDEDYLRMLRAVRFAARLGFTIEQRTATAITALARHLGRISRERIGQEVRMMLTSPGAAVAAALMQQLRLDGPSLNEDHAKVELAVLSRLEADCYGTALAAWMLDRHVPTSAQPIGRGETMPEAAAAMTAAADFARRRGRGVVRRWRSALCLSNDLRDQLLELLELVARAAQWPSLGVSARKRLLGSRAWPGAWRLLRALPTEAYVRMIERESAPLLAEGVSPAPLVDGQDLIGLGLTPGPIFKQLLEGVYDAQLEGRVHTRKQAIAWVRQQAKAGR